MLGVLQPSAMIKLSDLVDTLFEVHRDMVPDTVVIEDLGRGIHRHQSLNLTPSI